MSFLNKVFLYHVLITTAVAFYQNFSNITVLTNENFDENVNGSEQIWIIQFYSYQSSRCQTFVKEFLIGAKVLKGIIKFGVVNVENNTNLVDTFKINTKALPLVKFFGLLNDGHIDYNGPKLEKDLVDTVLAHILDKMKKQFGEILPENLVAEINDENFDTLVMNSKEPWLVQFHAPWCVHCKEFKPVWAQAAANLNGKIKFASLDATVNKIKANEYEIKAYPTVKLFPTGQKSLKTVLEYNKERSANEIINWALDILPGPDVVQITKAEVFENRCMEKKLCIIGILPQIFDCQTTCRENYLHILKNLGEKYKKQEWGWTWSEGGAQKELENVLNVGGYGYPTLVVLNPSKMKYTIFKGAFTKSNVDEFLIKLAKAHAVGVDQDILQKIVAVEPWDGKDSENDLPEELYLYDADFNEHQEL